MRILLLAPQVPWPMRQGTAIRNHHIAVQLAKRNEVTLVAFGEAGAAAQPLEEAGLRVLATPPPEPRSLLHRLLDIPTTRQPDLALRLMDPGMTSLLERLSRELAPQGAPDVLQIEGLEMALHGLQLHDMLARLGSSCALVYDAHNAEWVLQDRAWRADASRLTGLAGAAYSLAQTQKLKAFERELLRRVDATVAVSDTDASALRTVAPAARIAVVPNGVEIADYDMASRSGEEPALCVFVGKMDFRPNIDAVTWFTASVWPAVRAALPDARMAIVGRDPVARVRDLAAPDVEITGQVDDVRPWLAKAAVVVVPLRVGGGTRLKVLEAMAMGKAIVATTMAIEGLALQSDVEVVARDDAVAQADAIVTLATDPERRERLGRAARARAERDYRWEDLVPRIEALQRGICCGGSRQIL